MVANPSSSQSRRPFVVFQGVQKSYDGTIRVVKDLNLTIQEGEFLTLLGPSGSGKTTTLMMLAGFEKPTAGTIYLNDQPINDMPTYKRNFGMVFQNYALFPHMTVAQNVAFPLRMHRFPRSEVEGRVARALDMVRLDHVADRRPAQLSGGQQQRVALARALVFEPRMVLMDEPLGALDKQLREHMQLEIRDLHEKLGLTMLYVTHDQSEALTMSDRIAIFDDGRIQHIGAPDEVYDRPANVFVAGFMGENNVIEGTVQARDDKTVTVRAAAGGMVTALTYADLAVGDATQVMIRPERIVVGCDPVSEAVAFPARVSDVIYHGDHSRIVLDLDGVGRMIATQSRDASHKPPMLGDTLAVGWFTLNALAFPAGGSASATKARTAGKGQE